MKLRSFSVIALVAIGALGALSYKKVKNHFKKRLHREVQSIVQEEAIKIEKKMVEKYDMALWDQEDIDEFDKEQELGWDNVQERKEEPTKINKKTIEDAINKEHPETLVDLSSTKIEALTKEEKTKFTI